MFLIFKIIIERIKNFYKKVIVKSTYLEEIEKKLNWDIRVLKGGSVVSFLNPYSYLINKKNSSFNHIDYLGIDGIFLVLLLRFSFNKKIKRSAFDNTSLAPILYSQAINNKESIYFIGSTEENIKSFVKTIIKAYPKLNILDYRNGYFSSSNERLDSINKIIELNPDYVIVGMGSPFQEEFTALLKMAGYKGVSFTCGGYIHQTTKGFEYFPKIFNILHLRWLYRIYDEPKLFKRYFIFYPKSLVIFVKDYFSYNFLNKKK